MAIELDDGTLVRSLPEQVDYLTTANEGNEIAIDNLTARLEAALAGVLHYKGSVATYADLPADAEIGDVYNVIDTGVNYAWTGSEWDELGSSVDLSNYITKTDGTQLNPDTITGFKDFTRGIGLNSGAVDIYGVAGAEEFKIDLHGGATVYSFSPSCLYATQGENLGSSSYRFGGLYLSGAIDFDNNAKIQKDGSNRVNILYNNAVKVKVGGGDTYFANNVSPDSNGVYDLGGSSAKWKDFYLGGNIDFGSGATIFKDSSDRIVFNYNSVDRLKIGSANLNVRCRIDPDSNNTYDLGRSSAAWKDLYLAGNLSDGTNAVNIADLKALIDYAKAQGWIS